MLVTGANGFLGGHVVAALLGRGHKVRALVRPAAHLDGLGWGDDVEILRADLRVAAPELLESAFAEVDVLVHLAAAVTGAEDAQFAATVVGTERLLNAMARTKTRRIVLASSFSVYDWRAIRGTLVEESPLATGTALYARDGYAIAKAWQERITRRVSEENGWDLTVLRPGFIWGRGNAYLAALGQRVGPVHLVFAPAARLPQTYVENCADLFACAAEDPRAAGRTFNVIDDDKVRIWGYLGAYLRHTNERGVRVPIPYVVGSAATHVIQAISRAVFHGKGKLPGLLIPCRFAARFKPLRFRNQLAREVLDWRPPWAYDECLRRTYGRADPRPARQPASAGWADR